MSIDISKLSAKELFELARQREQEEQRQAEMNEHLHKLKAQREELLARFKRNLAKLDEEIKQLQHQRERLHDDHEAELARLDKEIDGTDKQVANAKADKEASKLAGTLASKPAKTPPLAPSKTAPTPVSQAAAAPEPAPAADKAAPQDTDHLYAQITELMRTREYISETLLKEKLRTQGYTSLAVTKGLEQLVKKKLLIRKAGGSYTLTKR